MSVADEMLTLFNGGLVVVPSLDNPRGYITMYRPQQAMQKVVGALTAELLECLTEARSLLTDPDAIDLGYLDEVIAKASGAALAREQGK